MTTDLTVDVPSGTLSVRRDLLAALARRADDDAAWLLVVRQYLDGLRQYPEPFKNR
jgi:hypothetical protein